jgi:hypothetical protein
MPTQFGGEPCHEIPQRCVLGAQMLGEQLQGGDLLSQLLIRELIVVGGTVVGWNSQRYARRSPRWRMASSEDLTDYHG